MANLLSLVTVSASLSVPLENLADGSRAEVRKWSDVKHRDEVDDRSVEVRVKSVDGAVEVGVISIGIQLVPLNIWRKKNARKTSSVVALFK